MVEAGERGQRPAVNLDEVSCAAPATQAAGIRVCCDRGGGDPGLPAVTVIGSGVDRYGSSRSCGVTVAPNGLSTCSC